jgi:hypothetical protein
LVDPRRLQVTSEGTTTRDRLLMPLGRAELVTGVAAGTDWHTHYYVMLDGTTR